MSRLTPLVASELDGDRRALFEAITGGKRGRNRPLEEFLDADGAMPGPFNAMLHVPALGAVVQRLGEALRFEGQLSDRCREIAILVVGAHWRARYEWWAHARIARNAGVPEEVLDAIADGAAPVLHDAAERAVHDFAREMVHHREASDAVYARARDTLGEAAVVELTMLLGYYSMISMLLNGFEVTLPAGASTPFDRD